LHSEDDVLRPRFLKSRSMRGFLWLVNRLPDGFSDKDGVSALGRVETDIVAFIGHAETWTPILPVTHKF
jgi:hypothetical protein